MSLDPPFFIFLALHAIDCENVENMAMHIRRDRSMSACLPLSMFRIAVSSSSSSLVILYFKLLQFYLFIHAGPAVPETGDDFELTEESSVSGLSDNNI